MRQRKGSKSLSEEQSKSHSDEDDNMTRFSGKTSQQPSHSPFRYLILGVGVLVVVMLVFGGHSSEKEDEKRSASLSDSVKKNSSNVGEIVEGEVQGQSLIPYYSCSGTGEIDMILLHGASFTKEDWKTSGLLKKLCHVPQISTVTALDLGNGANHAALKEALKALQTDQMTSSQPVALVTPSASGFTMVDWANEDKNSLEAFVKYWIPVAPPAVSRAEIATLESLGKIPILAVYGSRDAMGKKVSQRLEEHANAKMVEIEGGHPCYLDSPDAFVATVSEFLKV